jgi:hypothetical protein
VSKGAGVTLLTILLGGILGGYLGELLGLLIPTGLLHDIFIRGFTLGFDTPFIFNLRLIVVTFGVKIFINLLGVIGMIAGLYYSSK